MLRLASGHSQSRFGDNRHHDILIIENSRVGTCNPMNSRSEWARLAFVTLPSYQITLSVRRLA